MNLKDWRIPGVLWVALIVGVLAIVRFYVDDPLYVEVAVVIAFAILKSINLGDAEIEELLAIIARLQAQVDKDRPRGAEAAPRMAAQAVEKPNKLVRWLVG